MNFLEIFKQALDSIRANKLRAFLTLLALVIGVFSVLVSTTAVAVLDNYFTNTLSIMGSDVVTVQRNPAVQMGPRDASLRNRKRIKFQDAEQLNERVRISEALSPYETFNYTKVQYNDKETDPDVSIIGSNEHFLENNSYELEDGRNFSAEDIQYRRPFVLLGKDLQTELFSNEDPLLKTIRIDGKPYQVVGTLKPKGQIFGQSFDEIVVIPYTTGINVYGANRDISIQLRAPKITLIERTVEEVTGIMRVIRNVLPGQDNDFEIVTNESLSGTFDVFTTALYLGGAVIGIITLLGAGIGVMNIMLVSVTERTREIGIRKAVGATRRAIIGQFLIEAVFICQIGGIIGMILGIGAGNLMAVWIETETVIPLWSVLGSFFGMFLIGMLFGVYPAYKAAQLDPIESLRYE